LLKVNFFSYFKQKLDTLCILEKLLGFEIRIDSIEFRLHEETKRTYQKLFTSIIPEIYKIMLSKRDKKPSTSTSEDAEADPFDQYRLIAMKSTNPSKFESFMRIICYALICVPSAHLIKENFFNEILSFIFILKKLSPSMHVKLIISMAVSLCNYECYESTVQNNSQCKDGILENRQNYSQDDETMSTKTEHKDYEALRLDVLKLPLYESCSLRAIDVMSAYIRENEYRAPLKKALEIYCTFLARRLNELDYDDETFNRADIDSLANMQADAWIYAPSGKLYIGYKLNQLLYQIVIAIVRVLRQEFEDYDNTVDIELVIYFYEIIKVNFKGFKYQIKLFFNLIYQ
jgi:hypothetical protein